jgi:glycerate 2-kinase
MQSPARILVAPDSFKGSLGAGDVASAMARGIRQVIPEAVLILHPVSDGGEGLIDCLVPALGGEIVTLEVDGPLSGQRAHARWGIVRSSGTAVIEMAEASGLSLVPTGCGDPGRATTAGVGQLIGAALDAGARSLLIGIGGSATNDGGAGMAETLGAVFLDAAGAPLPRGGLALERLASVDATRVRERLRGVTVTVACDVTNPLTGPSGASHVFGPQKGADALLVARLDGALHRYAEIVLRDLGVDVLTAAGAGAGGGIGAGLLAFCGAHLVSGIDLVLDATGFNEELARVDLVLTGEGRIDRQTLGGKTLSGILRRAHATGVPAAAVVGTLGGERKDFVGPDGFAAIATLVNGITTERDAMENAARHIEERSEEVILELTAGAR